MCTSEPCALYFKQVQQFPFIVMESDSGFFRMAGGGGRLEVYKKVQAQGYRGGMGHTLINYYTYIECTRHGPCLATIITIMSTMEIR